VSELRAGGRTLKGMKKALVPAVAAMAMAAVFGYGCLQASAKTVEPDADRQVELTVYTQDFAQVTETRPIDLADGLVRITLTGLSHALDESTVSFDWPEGTDAQVTSTTYDLGTSSGQSLLEQLVGKEVTLVYRSENGREGERQAGVLEAAAPGNVVVRVGDQLVINPQATIEAPAGEVATMPRLTATVENGKTETQPLTFSYMTRGLSWSASYVVTLQEKTAELEAWATVKNESGVEYPDAKIKFVAGAPNRAVVPTAYADDERNYGFAGAAEVPTKFRREDKDYGLAYENVGELVAYPYESRATLRNNQTNRVLMLKEPKVEVVRDYAIRLPSPGWYGYNDATERLKATLSIAIKNSEESGLGQPLPGGRVRVFEPSKGGAPVLIGAATIGDTPKDDRIDLTLSEVFNLYARGKLVEAKKLDKRRTQYTYEVTVSNEKEKDVVVRLVAGFYGQWSIAKESVKSTKLDSGSAQWTLAVPASGETKLAYSVVIG
jgi:hypothetical protein